MKKMSKLLMTEYQSEPNPCVGERYAGEVIVKNYKISFSDCRVIT